MADTVLTELKIHVFDTDEQMKVHDGEIGENDLVFNLDDEVDYVVESQEATADNGYTWYRKYKSGWVEQGGKNSVQTVTLPIEMANTNYHIQLTGTCLETYNNVVAFGFRNVTTTGFITQGNVLNNRSETAASNNSSKHWYVCGFAA